MSIVRIVCGLFGSVALIFLWRFRIIQVTTFLAAAGVGTSRRASRGLGPASKHSRWSTLAESVPVQKKLNPLALVTYHAEYHAFDPQCAAASLLKVTQLGIGWVRTDLRWREIMPDGVHRDSEALSWYRSFLEFSSHLGLKNMVVLSTPPEIVLRQSLEDRLAAWARFVEAAASELGTHIDIYQLMNEPNNPVYRFFPLSQAAKALVLGKSIVSSNSLKAQVAVNISMEMWGWRRYLDQLLTTSAQAIDIVGLDHYPGTWALGPGDHWADVLKLADEIASSNPGSPLHGRRLAIIETGFATNTLSRGETEQRKYYEQLAGVLRNLKMRLPGSELLFGFYELCDWDSLAFLDPEAHFGLMKTDLAPKLAFKTVSNLVASL